MASSETEKSSSPEIVDVFVTRGGSSTSQSSSDFLKDTYLWKKKKRSVLVLAVSTFLWVMLEIYGFFFIPVCCWVAMSIVTSVFFRGNLIRLFHKEMSIMSPWGISEEFTMASQNAARVLAEEGIIWMFRVGVEDKWFVFAGVIAGLWVLSVVAGLLSFLSFAYIGVLIGMSVPFIFSTYADKMKGFKDRMEAQGRRWCRKVVNRFSRKMESEQNKVGEDEGKSKVE